MTLPLELVWTAPAHCPQADDIRVELTRIARPRTGRALQTLRATGEIAARAGGYVLQLSTETRGERGSTTLEAAQCADLERAATLVLALVLGDSVDLVEHDETPAVSTPVQTPHDSPSTPGPRDELPAAGRSSTPATTAWLEGGGALALGLTPSVAVGPRAGVLLRHAPWLFRASGTLWFSRSAPLNDGVRARFWATTLALGGCYATPGSGWAFGGCLGAELGVLHGQGSGAEHDRSATAPLYLVSPGIFVGYRASSRLTWLVNLGANLAPAPPRFVITGLGQAFETARAVPFSTLTCAVR